MTVMMSGRQSAAYAFDPMKPIPRSYRESITTLAGGNRGNIVFFHAARRLIDPGVRVVGTNELGLQDRSSSYDAILLLLANLFRSSTRNEALAESLRQKIEGRKDPIAVLSVGVQAPWTDSVPQLGPEVRHLIDVLAETSDFIGCRGAYTHKVLLSLGVPDQKLKILGCPSLFLNPNPRLGSDLAVKAERICESPGRTRPLKVIFAPTYPPNHHTTKSLLALGDEVHACYCMQSTFDSKAFAGSEVHVPESLDEWIEHHRGFDLAVSTRIHGALVAIAAGVPTLVVAHDARVAEMAELFGIPMLTVQQFSSCKIQEIVDQTCDGWINLCDRFDNSRRDLAAKHVKVLRALHITPSEHITRLGQEFGSI